MRPVQASRAQGGGTDREAETRASVSYIMLTIYNLDKGNPNFDGLNTTACK